MGTTVMAGMAVVFLSGVTQGLTGFGFSLVFVSLMLIFLPPKMVIPVVTVHAALINMIILTGAKKWVDLKRIYPLMIAGAAGLPFGTYVLANLDAGIMKTTAGVIVVLFAVAFLAGFRRVVRKEKSAFAWVGFLSGLLNGSIGMSGPPVILFFTNQGINKDSFRANLVAYFLVLNILTLGAFAVSGLVTQEVLRFSLKLVPAMVAGALLGMWLSGKVNDATFRKIALLVVIIAGMMCVAGGFAILR